MWVDGSVRVEQRSARLERGMRWRVSFRLGRATGTLV